MAQKIVFKKGVTAPDILDAFDTSVVAYMMGRRSIDETAMRQLIHDDQEVRASYLRKVERLVKHAIHDGVPAAFFGRKA